MAFSVARLRDPAESFGRGDALIGKKAQILLRKCVIIWQFAGCSSATCRKRGGLAEIKIRLVKWREKCRAVAATRQIMRDSKAVKAIRQINARASRVTPRYQPSAIGNTSEPRINQKAMVVSLVAEPVVLDASISNATSSAKTRSGGESRRSIRRCFGDLW
jgi:hypothetical protein